ncbi:SHOCT domain-containing protein [Candidatus Pyrohabitans sp.]
MREGSGPLAVALGLLLLFLPLFWMGGMMGFGMGAGVLFWAVLALLLYYAIAGGDSGQKDALKVLRERYARGEITREEFLRMKEEIGG